MVNSEFMVCFFCVSVSTLGCFLFDIRYFSRRMKALSDRIDKLVLQIEQLEMERDKLEK